MVDLKCSDNNNNNKEGQDGEDGYIYGIDCGDSFTMYIYFQA